LLGLKKRNNLILYQGRYNLSDGKKISNTEIKNYIEHSLKIIMSTFDERLKKIESKLIALESSINNLSSSGKSNSKGSLKSKSEMDNDKNHDSNLSDALKLIGKK